MRSQLNMLGDPDSCGVWAPCLTYGDGLFWLIYTDVKRYGRTTVGGASGASLRDFHNYLVTCPTIDGEWSDALYLNSSGFDPSLFHDDDGRKYVVNQLWDHRPGRNRFAGIVLQEYSPAQRKLIGERQLIFKGTAIGFTEAPHLYKRNGYYYLITAEGGTGWGHAMTMARSRSLTGPYELHPDKYIVTARRSSRMRRCIAPATATWWRRRRAIPMPSIYADARCPTAADVCSAVRPRSRRWSGASDDWLRTLDGSGLPELETPAPALPAAPFAACSPFARISTAISCPSTSSGCARRGPRNCSA